MISVIIPVFRDAARALDLVRSLSQQALPPGQLLEIIVVDDGSNDGSAELLHQCEGERISIVVLPRNHGRAAARNLGAAQAQGKFLAFIDCDCRPANGDLLAAHWRTLQSGCIASCGRVTGGGTGFWSHYQADTSARRESQHAQGIVCSGSSQNFAVERSAFINLEGFDTRYREYGFEDRDLFARLAGRGTIGWCRDAEVRHLDSLTLPGVLEKMKRAAGESAVLFMHDHAKAYRDLGYAAIDTRLNRWLRPACIALGPVLRTAPTIDSLIKSDRMPYGLVKPMVKLLVALAYAQGSMASVRPAAG